MDQQSPRRLQINPPSGFLRLDSAASQALALRGSWDLWHPRERHALEVTAAYRLPSEGQLTYVNSTGASGDVQARLRLDSQMALGLGYRFERPWELPLEVGVGLESRRERLVMKDGALTSAGSVTRPWLLARLRHRFQAEGFGPFIALELARPLTSAPTPSGVDYLLDLDHLGRSPNPGTAATAHAPTFGLTVAVGYRFGRRPAPPQVSTQGIGIEPLVPLTLRAPIAIPAEPPAFQAPKPVPTVAQPALIVLDEAALHFALDRSEIPTQGLAVLQAWAARLKALATVPALSVSGHSDATGRRPHNLKLSLARAQAVATVLRAEGLRIRRVEGLGPDHPLASNETSEGRAKNRRVEIRLEGIETRGQAISDLVPELPKSRKQPKK
jgi:outer membrane protein OmpA-like peptidoglycan-associated protein